MLYWGFGFLMLAITALVVGLAGVPGLGLLTNVALLVGLGFLAADVFNHGHRKYHFHRHAHR
jgi:hypothetical protein